MRCGELSQIIPLPCHSPIKYTPDLLRFHFFIPSSRSTHQAYKGDVCLASFKCLCQEKSFFSFCRGQALSSDNVWHCASCNQCRDCLFFHCKRCGHCSRETDLPCEHCSQRGPLERWQGIMNSLGSRKTATSQHGQASHIPPPFTYAERAQAVRWDKAVLTRDPAWTVVRPSRFCEGKSEYGKRIRGIGNGRGGIDVNNNNYNNACSDGEGNNSDVDENDVYYNDEEENERNDVGELLWIGIDQRVLPEGWERKFENDNIVNACEDISKSKILF